MIQCEGNTWKMVLIDENKAKGFAPPFFQKILCSNFFHTFFLLLVFANAITGATLSFQDQASVYNKLDGFYYAEVAYSVNFSLEFSTLLLITFFWYDLRFTLSLEILNLLYLKTKNVIDKNWKDWYFSRSAVHQNNKFHQFDFCLKLFTPSLFLCTNTMSIALIIFFWLKKW